MKANILKKSFLFFTLIFIFANLIFPQNADSESKQIEARISEFNITGLKRTKERYVQNLLSGFIGQPLNQETVKEIHTTLQAQNLFDEIKVTSAPLGSFDSIKVVVNVSVKEKLSFMPLPFAAFSSGNFMAGLFVMDMNAFGVHDNFIVGGLYSSDMIMGMGAYSRHPQKKGDFGFGGNFSVAKRESTYTNGDERKVLEYEAFALGAGARLLYKPTKGTTVSAGVGYDFFNPIDTDFLLKTNVWTTSLGWNISKSSWNGIFLSSSSVSVLGALHFSDNSDFGFGQSVTAQAKTQLPVAQKIRFLGTAMGFYGKDLYFPQYQNRNAAGVSILHNDFRTKEILGLSGGAEFCVLKMNFGMLSLYALYQAAFVQDWDESLYVGHGPEAGLRVYLAKVAFPAISMGGSYNVTNKSWQYSFSLGMGF